MHTASRTPLTPLAFLERSASVFADSVAVVHGDRRITYAQLAATVTRTAQGLRASGISPGDRVAYLCPNIPEMLVAHFAVPLAGAVLVAVNTRLATEEVRYILDHSRSRMLVVDSELAEVVAPLIGELETVEEVVVVDDAGHEVGFPATSLSDLLERGSDEPLPWAVDDEHATISVNYTSGTTGRPKGVMYTHRGAYLNALGEIIHSRHTSHSVYLWTLPMFHCNGWCTTWGVTAIGGTHVCLRAVRAERVWELIDSEGVTHLNGAPTILTTIANSEQAHVLDPRDGAPGLIVTTAGAPPSPTVIQQMSDLGAEVVHVYGLTETYGPHTICEVQRTWDGEDVEQRMRLRARQGVAMLIADPIRVVDDDMRDVPRDGRTMGEVVMRGNNVMKGYLDDADATEHAFRGGWFHSGDLGVWHRDGYIELRDRAKDIIVSGGENISTIEVEQALVSHPAVLEVAVIGVPDERWGERPKAFVIAKPSATVDADALREHARSRIAGYKIPDHIEVVAELPKTSTGKIQKFALRDAEWSGHAARIQG